MRVLLFRGKGGVGKTTLAAATAALLAGSSGGGALSTDPAHSLGDVLEPTERGADRGRGRGAAGHVGTGALLDGAWTRLREHLRTRAFRGGRGQPARGRAGACCPASRSSSRWLRCAGPPQVGPWEVVIVDCGPSTGNPPAAGAARGDLRLPGAAVPSARRTVRGLIAGMAGVPAGTQPAAGRWEATADALSGLAGGVRQGCTPYSPTTSDEHPAGADPRAAGGRRGPADAHRAGACTGCRWAGRPPTRCCPRRLHRPAARRCGGCAPDTPSSAPCWTSCRPPCRCGCWGTRRPHPGRGGAARRPGAGAVRRDDPLAGAPARPLSRSTAPRAQGSTWTPRFDLDVMLPGAARAPLELARLDDELVITIGGVRGLVALPSVLRRCIVTDAQAGPRDHRPFLPDPRLDGDERSGGRQRRRRRRRRPGRAGGGVQGAGRRGCWTGSSRGWERLTKPMRSSRATGRPRRAGRLRSLRSAP